jgi:hypothetical protein
MVLLIGMLESETEGVVAVLGNVACYSKSDIDD